MYRNLSDLSGPKCPRDCPPNMGVSEEMSQGMSPGLFGPQAQECRKCVYESVPEVSKRCPGQRGDILGTVFVHFLDTPEPGPRRHSVGHSFGHPFGHPPFSGDTLRDTLGAKGPKASCSRPVGSQVSCPFFLTTTDRRFERGPATETCNRPIAETLILFLFLLLKESL